MRGFVVNSLKKISFITIALVLSSHTLQAKKCDETKEIKKIGKESAGTLVKTLGKNMKMKMKSGGLIPALNFCSNEAYALTNEVNQKLPKGVSVKRISAQSRNPLNTPSQSELQVLESLEKLKSLNVVLPKGVVQKVTEKTFKYYKPLLIKKPVCLQCHGNIVNEDVKNAIASKYPNDKATGYKFGDLRGAVVVTIDRAAK